MNFIDKIAKTAGIALFCILFGSSSIIAMSQEDVKKSTTFINAYKTLNSDLERFVVVEAQYLQDKKAVEIRASQLDREAGELLKKRINLRNKSAETPTLTPSLEQQKQQLSDTTNSFTSTWSSEVLLKLADLEPRKRALKQEKARLKEEYDRLLQEKELLKTNAAVVIFMHQTNARSNDAVAKHLDKLY
jgi:septal ring factor EnvC (AmiA/AmiB activator)